jgi:hypothetical protein
VKLLLLMMVIARPFTQEVLEASTVRSVISLLRPKVIGHTQGHKGAVSQAMGDKSEYGVLPGWL